MDITKVIATSKFEKDLKKVPDFIQKKVLFWIFLVETQGLSETMKLKGYHDEPLKGQRAGQRSVRMNRAYRLIYRLIDNKIKIELLEVNKHDY
jgi:proteic killer suppression protein